MNQNHKVRNQWITMGVRVSAQNLKSIYNLMTQTGNLELANFYKNYKQIYKKVVKEAKKLQVYEGLGNKSIWKLIKRRKKW